MTPGPARQTCGRLFLAGGISPGPDGVAVYEVTAKPGAPLAQPEVHHGGAYHLVLRGEVTVADVVHRERSCIWVGPDDTLGMRAGAEGACGTGNGFVGCMFHDRTNAPSAQLGGSDPIEGVGVDLRCRGGEYRVAGGACWVHRT